jgi:hypothetical protein
MTESPSCPTVAALRAVLYAQPGEMDPAAQQITSTEQLEVYLRSKGLSIEGCDHLAMARLVRDFFLEVTDDDLLAAVGGEKFVAKAVVGATIAGATAAAVGAGVGAGLEVSGAV